jgi:hypothetical protein
MPRSQIFKHMMPKDIPVFATYVLSPEGQTYTSWEFDVLVGQPTDPGPFYPLEKRRQALYLNALKIDAIGWLYNTPTLIECKPDARLSAIGQIESYARWYQRMFNILPRKMIVCESMRGQVQTIAEEMNILVRIVPAADYLTIADAIAYVTPKIGPSPLFPNPFAMPS